MKYRARYKGRRADGKYVMSQATYLAETPTEAKDKAEQRLAEMARNLKEREGQEVNEVVLTTVEQVAKKGDAHVRQ